MNVVNILISVRILLIFVFMFFLFYSNILYLKVIAVVIFIVAVIIDSLDGYIVRLRKIVINFGKFLDFFVDKLLIIAVFVSLVEL